VEKQLAAQTFGFAFGLAEPGPMFLGAALAPGQDVERAKAEMLATLDALATEPVSAEELQRAKTQWLNDWEQGFTDPETVGVQLSAAAVALVTSFGILAALTGLTPGGLGLVELVSVAVGAAAVLGEDEFGDRLRRAAHRVGGG
jgi:predicted Zn-dependent peptidase